MGGSLYLRAEQYYVVHDNLGHTLKNIISREERLADLIEAIMHDIEATHPSIFMYGKVDFRAGLERAYYFSGVNDPQKLGSLLKAGQNWRFKAPDNSELAELYDDCVSATASMGSFCGSLMRNYIITIGFFWREIKGIFHVKRPSSISDSDRSTAFLALNRRFVLFFKDIVAELGSASCYFLPGNYESIELAVSEVGAEVAYSARTSVEMSLINMNPFHSLWAMYLYVLDTFLNFHGTLQNLGPAALVFAEGTAMEDEVACQAATILGIPTVKVQSGRASILDSGYRRASFYKTLCWGEGFAQRFKEYSPRPYYVITGNPLLDGIGRVSDDSGKKKPDDAKVTLVVFTQPVSMHISDDEYLSLVKLVEEILLLHPQLSILVRKHPADQSKAFDMLMSKYDRIRLMAFGQYPLSKVLGQSQFALSFFSTTLSEAAAYGVIPVIFKLNQFHSAFPFPEKYGAALVAESHAEALDIMSDLLNDQDLVEKVRKNMDVFVDQYFGPRDDMALKRIVHHIQNPYAV